MGNHQTQLASNGSLNEKTRILIVDDHPVIRHSLVTLIGAEPDWEVCGEAGSVPEAMRLVREAHPHVVLIDLTLAGGHGLELIEKIRIHDDKILMLVSSMHEESLYAERALRAGARGYINKSETIDKLVGAIRHVLDGGIYLSSPMTSRVLYRATGGESLEKDAVELLSNRELEVFELIGQGMTTREIAKTLNLSAKTIESHREKIKAKLGVRNGQELNRRAFAHLNVGLAHPSAPPAE